MNADDAFSKLMQSDELAIPLARAESGDQDVSRFLDHLEKVVLPVDIEPDLFPEADIAALDRLAARQPDYKPPSPDETDDPDDGRGRFPTVTDLPPASVADADTDTVLDGNLEDAYDEGAVILGRDMRTPASRRLTVPRGSESSPRGTANLARARRFRRFAQLPLVGADRFEAAARELAANLSAADPEKPSLLLTSSLRREGRTELAIRLSLAMARRVGARVVLVDFDLKNPRIAPRLGIPVKYFVLADVLNGACPLEEALVVGEEDNLYVLPSRPSDRDGDDVLDANRAGGLMDLLHRTFDFAVLDCGPATQSEALVLCRNVGFTALAAFGGESTRSGVTRAAEKLDAAGARLAGVLLAGAR